MIATGAMVVDAVYFNMVGRAPYWYMQLELTTVIEVRYVLRSGLQLEEISDTNKLPLTCNRLDTAWKRAVNITAQEHEAIVEEVGRCVRLEFSKGEDSNDVADDESGSEVESDGDDNSLNSKKHILTLLVCSRKINIRHHPQNMGDPSVSYQPRPPTKHDSQWPFPPLTNCSVLVAQ